MHDKHLLSKVLVLDNSAEHAEAIKKFCDDNNLVGLKVHKDNLMSVLRSNIDLGAILYSENYGDTPEENQDIAMSIHSVRSELPLILRREHEATLDDLPEEMRKVFCASYVASNMDALRGVIDEYIFCLVYPNDLVRGIAEISGDILSDQFKTVATTSRETPYIVRDRIIFGEVFSLIPLESAWCRGYMMLQSEEEPIIAFLNRIHPNREQRDFRAVNSFLGEITNLIWGAFKNRYIGEQNATETKIQVPLIVNHKHKYISFGSENPQLCFIYTLTDDQTGQEVKLYQRFIFNLSWSPEDFKEIKHDVEELVDSGELELF